MKTKTKMVLLLIIGICHYVNGQKTKSFILPDEAIEHVWRTTDSDGVIFHRDLSTEAANAEGKDALKNSCGTNKVLFINILVSLLVMLMT